MESQSTLWLVLAVGVILALALRLYAVSGDARSARERADREVLAHQVQAQERIQQALAPLLKQIGELSGRVEDRARDQFDQWRQTEVDAIRLREVESARREAHVLLDAWKVEAEAGIRTDAIQRSHAVITGKVTEHVAPYLPQFRYNPRDARFLGTPVDFVVFDGLEAGAVRQVVFIEVKAGGGSLSPRERQVRDAVSEKRVSWEQLRIEVAPTHSETGAPPSGMSARRNPNAQVDPVPHADVLGAQSRLSAEPGHQHTNVPGVPSRTIRAICSGCREIVAFTVQANERSAECDRCGAVQTFNIDGIHHS